MNAPTVPEMKDGPMDEADRWDDGQAWLKARGCAPTEKGDGVVVVPREPTDEMHHAGQAFMETHNASDVWSAMIAATQQATGEGDKGNHDCLAKRRPGEPMFILLGRDPDAHNIVRSWAERRLAAGGDPEHCQMGLDTAERMRAYASDPANAPASAPPASAYPAAQQAVSPPEGVVVPREADKAWIMAQAESLSSDKDPDAVGALAWNLSIYHRRLTDRCAPDAPHRNAADGGSSNEGEG